MTWPSQLAVVAGVAVLLGWTFDIDMVKSVFPGLATMKPNTALSFVLAGASLWLSQSSAAPLVRAVSLICGALVLFIGSVTCGEYLDVVAYNIDELLFTDSAAVTGELPGRMAATTAIALTFLGAALLSLHLRSVAAVVITRTLAACLALVAVPTLLAYGYDPASLQRSQLGYTPMALHTSIVFVALGFQILMRGPDSALRRVLASDSFAAHSGRQLLAAAVVIPLLTSLVALRALDLGLVGATVALTLVATANIGVLVATAMWHSQALDRAEHDRKHAEARRTHLAAIVDSSSDSVVGLTRGGTITSWNAGAVRIFGYSAEEALGKTPAIIAHPSRTTEPFDLIDRAANGEVIAAHETLRRRKDGSDVEVSLALSAIRDEAGAIVGVSTIARDIGERKRLERKAHEAEVRLRTLIDTAPLGVFVVEDGRFTYVNPVMSRIFGYTEDELIGAPAADLVTDLSDLANVRVDMRHRFEQGLPIKYETICRTKAGERRYIEVHGGVVDDGKRRLIGMLVDATERKQMQDALAKSEALLREAQAVAHLGGWELDLVTNHLYWSDETFRIFGIDSRAFGASYEAFLDRVHPDDRAMVDTAYIESVKNRTQYAVDHRMVMTDGTLKHVHERCVTYYDAAGRATRSLGTVQDITERKRAEEALGRLNDQLEERVEARTAQLLAANKELEAFSYSVSHDLRAPLRALQGFSRILLDEHFDELGEQPKHYLELIRDNARQMGALIDDLLAFSRLGRQSLRADRVNICALVEQAFEQLAPEREGRDVSVRVHDVLPCRGDATLLRQVVLNLLSNALKFTRTREHTVVEIGCAPQHALAGERVYYVQDNGVGFDMAYAGKLFGIFQRLHAASEYEGTGVGLAIVQRVVQRHGGRVWAQATEDQGATFYFSLPEAGPHGA